MGFVRSLVLGRNEGRGEEQKVPRVTQEVRSPSVCHGKRATAFVVVRFLPFPLPSPLIGGWKHDDEHGFAAILGLSPADATY